MAKYNIHLDAYFELEQNDNIITLNSLSLNDY